MTTNRRSERIDRPLSRRGVLALAASGISMGALLAACGGDDSADEGDPDPAGDPGSRPAGVDVSNFAGSIDWGQVAAAGYRFAIVKAAEGTGIVDPLFAANWSGSQAERLRRGAYHFFDPDEPGADQAEHFLSTVGPDLGELPPTIDLEIGSPRPEDIRAWLDAVELAVGVTPMIYTTVAFADEHLNEFGSYPLWIADYEASSSPTLPGAWSSWAVWQHTIAGSVPGIDGEVDLNVYAGPLPG